MPLVSLLAAQASTVDKLVFIAGATIVLAGAIGVVSARNPVHAALLLVQTLFGVAVLFVAQGAHFLAAVQVIVYAGAIVVLFLFVIMLLGVDKEELVAAEPMQNQAIVAGVVVVITLAEVILLGRGHWATGTQSVVGALQGPGGNVQQLAEVIFTRYLFAFEATSVLLVIAVVAAVALARRPEGEDVDAEVVAASAAEDAAKAAAEEAIAELVDEEASAQSESQSEEVSS